MAIKATPSFSLKDQLFNAHSLAKLTERLQSAMPSFQRAAYERAVLNEFPKLELKERIDWMVTALEDHLPDHFPDAVKTLKKTLPPKLDPSLQDDDFGEFIWSVPAEYVAKHGVSRKHLKPSLSFLRESTQRFSAENAIRPFLAEFPEETLQFVRACSTHKNYHVRRLASEGIRPFLPWAMRVQVPSTEIVDILGGLYSDPTRYVTRSVANTLNDVSRIDPDLVVRTLGAWEREGKQGQEEFRWLRNHSLRTLVKQDHSDALRLLGYPLKPKFRLEKVVTNEQVNVGDNLKWQGTLVSDAKQKLRVSLRVYFLKSNGNTAAKVFAVSDCAVRKGETVSLGKTISFKPMTTRTLYPGTHALELVVNGVVRGRRSFELVN